MRIINVISRTDAYILIRDLNLKPRAAGTIDVDTLILSELKSLRNLYLANDIIISENDFNYIVNEIVSMSGGLDGGTASYPSFTGNAAKVLTVNTTEDDVEWTTAVTQVYVDAQDTLLQDQIDLKANTTDVDQSLAIKADLIDGLIPASQLPSYVDDVLNFTDLASFPSLGKDGKIYVAEDVNKTYRWGGSSYVEIGDGGVALGETSSTAYRGDNGKIAYDHSLSQGNPHNTTTSEINEGTKLFFTEDRVNQTVLTGLDTSTATPALATDQLLAAIGKLQSQINSMSPTWVDVTTLNGFSGHANIDWTQSLVEVANIDGLLWIRGFLRQTAIFSGSQVFTHTDSNYVGNINYPAIDAFDSVNLTDVKGRGVSLGNVSFTTVVNRVNPLVPIFQFTLVGILNQTYTMLEPTALSRA